MAQRIPFELDAEFVGIKAAGEFVRRDTQERVSVPAKVKFLTRADDGDVDLLEVPGTQLDKVQPPVDYASLGVGDRVKLAGVCVIMERGSDRDSYVQWQGCAITSAAAKPVRAAS